MWTPGGGTEPVGSGQSQGPPPRLAPRAWGGLAFHPLPMFVLHLCALGNLSRKFSNVPKL